MPECLVGWRPGLWKANRRSCVAEVQLDAAVEVESHILVGEWRVARPLQLEYMHFDWLQLVPAVRADSQEHKLKFQAVFGVG